MIRTFSTFLITLITIQITAQSVTITPDKAKIENEYSLIEFNLETGHYSGTNKRNNTVIFKEAKFLIDRSRSIWDNPGRSFKAEEISIPGGKQLRFWNVSGEGYDPASFLDITILSGKPYIILGWGIKNDFNYDVRVKQAEVLFQGKLFSGQKIGNPKVLRGGAGSEANFVENTWKIDALNSVMLTYNDENKPDGQRTTLVAGGLQYSEFLRKAELYEGAKRGSVSRENKDFEKQPYITLTISDPQGKRIKPGTMWKSEDNFYLDFATDNPFESLENYGRELARANDASPNPYNFPTLCGWMVSTIGEGKPINNSPGLVNQMELAKEKGLNKYTSLAIRLEPDYYCYRNQGNTQQGWWNDEYWAKYGSLKPPYETFAKFSKGVKEKGGQVFTYFQSSMPSNDFALAHPEWMLNDDISMLHVDHPHHIPLISYDYTNPDFQKYVLKMWSRLRKDGVIGIKFDYPETAWARDGGFDDNSYTTTSAYRKVFELCREGMGEEVFIHERALGETNTPRLDCTAGVVDLQRVWGDASHFEPEMASRMGLRWYKQGIVFRYYPDGKSFYRRGEALSAKDRRTFLTLVGLLSGRIELGTSIGSMTDEMIFDLTRLYPALPNGKTFRPVDFLMGKDHPEVYVYDVNEEWKQVIMVNNSTENIQIISAPFSGDQVSTGSLGFEESKKYVVYDFWYQKSLGVFSGNEIFSQLLDKGEALVYSVKEIQNHPQIIGTNRHVMCGMFEIKDEKWDENTQNLTFKASVIEGETMNVVIHLPEHQKVEVTKLIADNAESSFVIKNNCVVISLLNSNENRDVRVIVEF